MDIDPGQYHVMRQLGQRGFLGAERDQAKDLRDAGCKGEFQSDKTVVMSAAEGFQCGPAVWGNDLGARPGKGRRNSRAESGECAIRSRTANDNPSGTGFGGKKENASGRGSSPKRNDNVWRAMC